MKKQEAIKSAKLKLTEEINKLKDAKVAAQSGRPFPVPPSGCPEGWYESGGMCKLDS